MNLPPSLLRRSFAKIIDYTLLLIGAIGVSFALSYTFSSACFLLLVLSISFLWLPFDILFQKFFNTTPGQFLVGIKAEKRQKWATLCKYATVASFKSFTILIPFFNLIAVWFITKKEPVTPHYLIRRKGLVFPRILGFILFFAALGFSVLEIELDDSPSRSTQLVAGQMTRELNWKEFNLPTTDWQAKFPKTPKERDFMLQVNDKDLKEVEVTEHFHKDEKKSIEYTISSIELDESLLHWGYKRVLKGSLEIVVENIEKGKLISKAVLQFKDKPAIHYNIQDGKNERMGRLILVNSTLYRVETTYLKKNEESVKDEIFNFLDSFEI
ncbi:MAG: hypothetical protein P0S95_06515 [Rhabdochlamydiaceae bacterium]|nr:hypothetical protein [Candidatus Amphrikana amoebophyrae]